MLGLSLIQDVMIGVILVLLPTLRGSTGQVLEEFVSAILRLGCFDTRSLTFTEFVRPLCLGAYERCSKESMCLGWGCVLYCFCLSVTHLSQENQSDH